MKLKDFIAETLKEIVNGVAEAQEYYRGKGGSINSDDVRFHKTDNTQMWNYKDGQPVQQIDFDVAVTTTEGTETKGGIGIFVGPIGLGSQGKSDAINSSSSRIKFSIPILLPKG